jgi:hypothetical protein
LKVADISTSKEPTFLLWLPKISNAPLKCSKTYLSVS